jgi:hypothetical protein
MTNPFALDFNITRSEFGPVHSQRGEQGVYGTLLPATPSVTETTTPLLDIFHHGQPRQLKHRMYSPAKSV